MIDCVGQNEHDHLEETWRWAYVRGKELTAMRLYKSCQVAAHLHQSFHGIFSEICKNVTTVEAWMEVRRALHVVNSSVMQMAAEADKNKGLEGVSSLPATRNSARKKTRKKRPHEH